MSGDADQGQVEEGHVRNAGRAPDVGGRSEGRDARSGVRGKRLAPIDVLALDQRITAAVHVGDSLCISAIGAVLRVSDSEEYVRLEKAHVGARRRGGGEVLKQVA